MTRAKRATPRARSGLATRFTTPLAALRTGIGAALTPVARAADTGQRDSSLHASGRLDLTTDNRTRGISTSANRPTAKATTELLHDPELFAELVLTRVSKAQVPRQPPHGAAARRRLSLLRPQGLAVRARDTQHSRFPVARLPGLSGTPFTANQDSGCGEFVDIQSVAVGVTPTITETFLGVSDGLLQARYVHTLSRTFLDINAATVCPAIAEPIAALASLEAGPQDTRGSQYIEVAYGVSALPVHRAGCPNRLSPRDRVEELRYPQLRVGLRIRWRSREASAGLTRARPRAKGVYGLRLDIGTVRDTVKAALVVAADCAF
jgi:hypothetical protein